MIRDEIPIAVNILQSMVQENRKLIRFNSVKYIRDLIFILKAKIDKPILGKQLTI